MRSVHKFNGAQLRRAALTIRNNTPHIPSGIFTRFADVVLSP
jgi:hypothetical protein